ncbi:type II secretion system GspH family protein [Candidatus Kaiserbacteria bacterium]|nr:type II secretion system GspH family protein [Candidatus Kaiserbacteria bacterium]
MYTNTHRGFSLVETLVAITVLILAVIVPMRVATQSVKTATLSREQFTATYLAQEGIEYMIALRDDDALDGGDTWSWYDDISSSCKNSGVGCSVEPTDESIVSCTSDNCLLYVDEDRSSGAYYTHSSSAGDASPYTRTIVLEETTSDEEVLVTSTVSWTSSYVEDTVSIVEKTVLFNLYE